MLISLQLYQYFELIMQKSVIITVNVKTLGISWIYLIAVDSIGRRKELKILIKLLFNGFAQLLIIKNAIKHPKDH